jgi:hypothetical protein
MASAYDIKIQNIGSSNLSIVVDLVNKNLNTIVNNINGFYDSISYDNTNVKMSVNELDAQLISISNKIQLITSGGTMFSVDSSGNIIAKTMAVNLINTPSLVMTSNPTATLNAGQLGQIVWTGADFMGMTSTGWKSFTNLEVTLPTVGNSSYGNTMYATLFNNSTGNIFIGDSTSATSLNMAYNLNRNGSIENGTMEFTHNGIIAQLTYECQRTDSNIGVTFTAYLDPSKKIMLKYTVDNKSSDVQMSYALQKINKQ